MAHEGGVKEAGTKEEYGILNLAPEQIFTFAEGLPGFEKIKQYCLLAKEDDLPFLHLTATGGFDLEFVVVNPWVVMSDYDPEISPEDLDYIGAESKKDVFFLATVVINEPLSESSVNLAAPIIFNFKTCKGKQIVLRNIKDYSSQHQFLKNEQ